MKRIALLGDESCSDGHASVRLTRFGRCELLFKSSECSNAFPCSLSSLINVGLGAKTHLASDFGACALTKTPGGVKITLTPWGADSELYLVPMDVYADALAGLSEAHSVREKISLR